jgi:hypothetical protein
MPPHPIRSLSRSRALAVSLPLVLALAPPASAQDSARGPRSPYWQQHVAYDITAALDEPSGVLAGAERIRYVNHSPATLTTFSLHLYLNAFRPGSRWSDADSAEHRRRFNDLKDPDYGFNHVRDVRIMGEPVTPTYPFAPDSTIVRFALPHPLAPGDSMDVSMNWDARPSTVPRRQGRQGRRFDFAQWYPKVVVFDRYGWEEHPLYPAGEFYGEFGTFRVQLDVPDDQVVGATGVPLCGDPGWERASANPAAPVEYQRDWYGPRGAAAIAGGCDGAAPGRKRIVWYADQVHNFAMSLNPQYRYEGGRFNGTAVHVLYQPGDSATWGHGIAVTRTETALAWLERIYGPFGWPQISNVHRIEGGGTEFPMMIHDGSADQGLIVHELGHNYTMGMLANNEWKEGWLDEGFTSFQTAWFWEVMGRPGMYENTERQVLELDLDGQSEPTSLVSEDYKDFVSYNISIYTRGELFFQQLRHIVGDETMLRILREFYARWQFRHVDESAFRDVAESVSGKDLGTFFGQWLHSVPFYDYSVGRVKPSRAGDGWTTRVEVVRKEQGRIPVDVAVIAEHDTAVVRTDGLAERAWVEVATRSKPKEIVLDPLVRTHDWNMLNNRRRLGLPKFTSLVPPPGTKFYLDTYVKTPDDRDRLSVGILPTVWYNDAGGITVGLRTRDDYLGRFEQNQALLSWGTGLAHDPDVTKPDLFLRARNPVFLRGPGLSETFEAFRVEGRHGGLAALEQRSQPHLAFGPSWRTGVSLRWIGVEDTRYLDPGYYEDVGTVEASAAQGVAIRSGPWRLAADATLTGGLAYAKAGLAAATGRLDADQFYGRVALSGSARRTLGKAWGLGARLFAGTTISSDTPVKQRQTYLAGSDPYEQLYNPFLRSRGALLVRPDVYYATSGGAGLRGYDPRLSTIGVVAANLELERYLRNAPKAKLFRRVSAVGFGDFGQALSDGTIARPIAKLGFLGDAGIGLRAEHQIGERQITTRVEFPVWVSRPELAQDTHPGLDHFGFRWLVALGASF